MTMRNLTAKGDCQFLCFSFNIEYAYLATGAFAYSSKPFVTFSGLTPSVCGDGGLAGLGPKNFIITEKKIGVRKIPKNVTPIIPLKTAVPRAWRISAPAPFAIVNGNTPSVNANDVIRIGRSRTRAASVDAVN